MKVMWFNVLQNGDPIQPWVLQVEYAAGGRGEYHCFSAQHLLNILESFCTHPSPGWPG